MGWWTRDRLGIIGGLALVGGIGVGTVWALGLAPGQRSDALALLGIALGLVGVLPLVFRPERGHPSAASRSVDGLATQLAEAVSGQWRRAATDRRLVTPEPILLRWSLSTLTVTGPVAAGGAHRFSWAHRT